MKNSELSLFEQLKITPQEIKRRKAYFALTSSDSRAMSAIKPIIAENIEQIVEDFYDQIISFNEMDRLIGDAETLSRLKNYQKNYILSLFDGQYDEEYVHSRLRIGVVHKRIGVDPKFYVSSVNKLISLLEKVITANSGKDCRFCQESLAAVSKVIMFDLSLTFDTYIYSLINEVHRSREELENYAEGLEQRILERTRTLKKQARHDGLTQLLNQHSFYSELRKELLRGQRRNHATVLIYFDLDGFKKLNDTQGHQKGDEILKAVAESMKSTIRQTEILARYGGDEFCIILPESNAREAENVCNRLFKSIKETTRGSGISCSVGIAVSSPDHALDADTLVKKADTAMYQSKKKKGFSVTVAPD